jgi:hypothetical protein
MPERAGEIIEASTTEFVAQSYELYDLPPLGALVKTDDGTTESYGIVYHALTESIEPGRRPLARGKDEPSPEAVYRANPQLASLLRSEFSAIVVGHWRDGKLLHYLPPAPARIHGFVFRCSPEEIRKFSASLSFLDVLLGTTLPMPVEEVSGAALRLMAEASDDGHAFLLAAGKELAVKLSGDFNRLRSVLGRLKG